MVVGAHKDVRKLIGRIEQAGVYHAELLGTGHIGIYNGDGALVYTMSNTPSSSRWYRNNVADLKRAGILPAAGDTKVIARGAIRRAGEFLLEMMQPGENYQAKKMTERLMEEFGIADSTAREAARRVGIVTTKGRDHWYWSVPLQPIVEAPVPVPKPPAESFPKRGEEPVFPLAADSPKLGRVQQFSFPRFDKSQNRLLSLQDIWKDLDGLMELFKNYAASENAIVKSPGLRVSELPEEENVFSSDFNQRWRSQLRKVVNLKLRGRMGQEVWVYETLSDFCNWMEYMDSVVPRVEEAPQERQQAEPDDEPFPNHAEHEFYGPVSAEAPVEVEAVTGKWGRLVMMIAVLDGGTLSFLSDAEKLAVVQGLLWHEEEKVVTQA
jgi:hypothetical protein